MLLQRVGVIMMVSGKYCFRGEIPRESVDTGFEPGIGLENNGVFEREWIG